MNLPENLTTRGGSEGLLTNTLDAWTNILVYSANRCNRESHAKQLSGRAIPQKDIGPVPNCTLGKLDQYLTLHMICDLFDALQ